MAAEIIAFDVRADNKAEYVAAIQNWCLKRNLDDALTRQEIGAMQGFQRIDALRKGLLLGLVEYYRHHERADVAPAVLSFVTMLCDNDGGAASISQPTMAKLLNRSLSSIGDAHKRLREAGLITTSRGRYAATVPVIPRAVTKSYNHLAWLVEAAANVEQPINLPVPQVDCQSTGPVRGLTQSTGPVEGLKQLNPPDEPVSIHRGDRCLLHYKNSTTLNKATAAVIAGIATAIGTLPAAADLPPEPTPIARPAKVPLSVLAEQMMDAAGPALKNPAACPGLLMTSELQRWLDAGCDFESDVLPAIRAAAARRPPASISTWGYFTQAVADAKALRQAPMPKGNVSASQSPQSAWHKEQDKALAFIFKNK